MTLEQVAFDVETTGFGVTDEVTVVGFAVSMGVRVFVQTGGRPAGDVTDTVAAVTPEPTLVNVSTHTAEDELLGAVSEFVGDRVCGENVLLVAYNGERWNGGFDLPFLRSRYANRGVSWPFIDVPYADLLPVIANRFNTTIDGDEQNDLGAAYDVLCDGSHGDVDPFAESSEAVTAFEDAQFADLALHTVADVLRTRALGRLAEQYCAKSEFQVKSLTPTRTE